MTFGHEDGPIGSAAGMQRAVAAMETLLLKGVAEAMNLHNQGPPEAPEHQ